MAFEETAFEGIWQGGDVRNVRDVFISRNFFRNVGKPAGAYAGLPAIQVNAHNAIISDNILRDVGTGIGASGSRISVVNNRIEGVEVAGIGTGDGGPQEGMIISGNTIRLNAHPTIVRVGILVEPAGEDPELVLVTGNHIHVQGHDEHPSPIGIRIVKGAFAAIANNAISVTRKGVGIGMLGDRQATRVHLTGNTVHFRQEGSMSYGISGVPNGEGKHLIVSGSGNSVSGLSVQHSSFGLDFNIMGGGTYSIKLRNDRVDGGYVRFGSQMKSIEAGEAKFVDSP